MTSGPKPLRPPFFSRWILERVVPPGQREFLIGDLREGFERRRVELGSGPARSWFRRQALGVLGHLSVQALSSAAALASSVAGSVPKIFTLGWGKDISLGLRQIRLQPGFSLAVFLTLTLGIGANTAVFTLVNGLLLRPLPYPEAHRLVHLGQTLPELDNIDLSYPDFDFWRSESTALESMAVYDDVRRLYTGNSHGERVEGAAVSWGLFPALGIDPILGRTFRPEEDRQGAARVVVVSHGFWSRSLGERVDALGSVIVLDGTQFEVVGVMPPGFHFPEIAQFWTPVALDPATEDPLDYGWDAIARLAPGASLQSARAEAEVIAERLSRLRPEGKENLGGEVYPLRAADVPGRAQAILWALTGAVGLVLLIACTNIANLLLVRASSRQREVSLRLALGAGRMRLARQLIGESAVVGICGALAGLLLGVVTKDLVLARISHQFAFWIRFDLDYRVVLFVVVISILAVCSFSVIPVWTLSRCDLAQGLRRQDGRSGSGPKTLRFKRVLVAAEVALSVLLLIAAGLMLRTFSSLVFQDLGFDAGKTFATRVWIPDFKYPELGERARLRIRILDEVKSLPGVVRVAAATELPLTAAWQTYFVPDTLDEPKAVPPVAYLTGVTEDYFSILGIPLVNGRAFERSEVQGGSDPARVVIVGETVAARHWPGLSPLGRQLHLGREVGDDGPWTIVGVAGDVHQSEDWDSTRDGLYIPYPAGGRSFRLIVDGVGAPSELTPMIRDLIAKIDQDMPVYSTLMVSDIRYRSLWMQRLFSELFSGFGALAVVLAAVGIYGVVSFGTLQQRCEIGVRLAVGARSGQVVGRIVLRSLMPVLAGVAVGLGAAVAATTLLESGLRGTSPTDPMTYSAVAAILLGVAVGAAYLPARRASRLDPTTVLRSE